MRRSKARCERMFAIYSAEYAPTSMASRIARLTVFTLCIFESAKVHPTCLRALSLLT